MFPENEENCEYIIAGKLSSPTCQQLGIPRDEKQPTNFGHIRTASPRMRNECYSSKIKTKPKLNPFSPYCMIPLPAPFGSGLFDPACLRRRNERERDRVRCVNEGYLRLKEHLPITNKEKRMSKVDTLRCAIKYIKHLKTLLDEDHPLNTDSVDYNIAKNEDILDCYHGNNTDYVKTNLDAESDNETMYFSTDSGEATSDSDYTCKYE